jgi:ubiquinone/menaquinone biosynthesis C-methylase UbiE
VEVAEGFERFFQGGASYFKLEPTGYLLTALGSGAAVQGEWALDLGCGNGRNALALASLGYNCIAADISPSSLLVLERELSTSSWLERHEHGKIFPLIASATCLPIRSSILSVAFCGTILSCLDFPEIDLCLSELNRCMLESAKLIISDFSDKDPGASAEKQIEASECASEIKTYFTAESLTTALEKNGFDLTDFSECWKYDASHGKPHYHSMYRLTALKRNKVKK